MVRKIDFVFKEGSTRPACKTSHQGDRTRGFFAPCDLIWLLWNYFIYVGHYISWFPSLRRFSRTLIHVHVSKWHSVNYFKSLYFIYIEIHNWLTQWKPRKLVSHNVDWINSIRVRPWQIHEPYCQIYIQLLSHMSNDFIFF